MLTTWTNAERASIPAGVIITTEHSSSGASYSVKVPGKRKPVTQFFQFGDVFTAVDQAVKAYKRAEQDVKDGR